MKPILPQTWTVPRTDDKCLECVGTRSIHEHFLCRFKLHRAKRIGQIQKPIIWELYQATYVQADGEAVYVSPCTLKMSHCDQIPFIRLT